MRILARLLMDQGELFEAEKMLVVVEDTNTLRGDFVQQLQTRLTLGRLWILKGEYQKAEGLLREVFEAKKQYFGPENRETLESQLYLGRAQYFLGRILEAEELVQDTFNKFARTLGRNHATTLKAGVFFC